ncbi:MAG: glycosyltransferase [Patescibacteria group bacterium]|nr:glycosyltransferase [Patescibacteria group bacterium]
MEINVAIPTYNRPDDLRRCIDAVIKQSLVPHEVMVVDDGNLSAEMIAGLRGMLEAVGSKLVYIKKDHDRIGRGTSESRNLIMFASHNPVLVIDDDIVLDPDCILNMAKAWSESEDDSFIGVGGVISNNRHITAPERLYNRLFSLGSESTWDINDVGYQVWDDSIKRREKGHYAHGGFCMYRPEFAREILFPVFQDGKDLLEDIHFALVAKILGYWFIIEPKATCLHLHSKAARRGQFSSGFRESVNRKIIFRDLCGQGRRNCLRFAWASFGWVLRQFLAGHFFRGAGMTAGMFAEPSRYSSA